MRYHLCWLACTICFLLASALTLDDIPGWYERESGKGAARIDFFNGGTVLTKNDFKINSQTCTSGTIELVAGHPANVSRAGALYTGVTRDLLLRQWVTGTLRVAHVASRVVCPGSGTNIAANVTLNFFVAAKNFSPKRNVNFVKGNKYMVFDGWSSYKYKGPPAASNSTSPPDANSPVLTMQSIPALYEKRQGISPDEIRFSLPPNGGLLNHTAISVAGKACQSGKIQFAMGANLNNTASGVNFTNVLLDEKANTAQLITGLTRSALNCSGTVIPSNLKLNLFIAGQKFSILWEAVFPHRGVENATLPFQKKPFEFQKGMKYLVIGDRTVYQDNAYSPPNPPTVSKKKANQRTVWAWAGPLIGVGAVLFVLIIAALALWKCRAKVHSSAWYAERQTIARDKSLNRPSIDASSHKIPWHNRR